MGRRQRAGARSAPIAGIARYRRARNRKDLSLVDGHRGIREVNSGVESPKSLFFGVDWGEGGALIAVIGKAKLTAD